MDIYKDAIGETLGLSPLYLPEIDMVELRKVSTNSVPCSQPMYGEYNPMYGKKHKEDHPFVGGKLQKEKVANGTHHFLNSVTIITTDAEIKVVSLEEYYNNDEYVSLQSDEGYKLRGLDPNIRFLPTPLKRMDERHKNTLKGEKRTLAQKLASKEHSEKWHTFGKSPTPRGGKLSEEHKHSLRKPKSKFTKPYHKCPHCGLEGHSNGMKRWHFDNCKQKVINLI
jgi:hypothetical protein